MLTVLVCFILLWLYDGSMHSADSYNSSLFRWNAPDCSNAILVALNHISKIGDYYSTL